VSHPVSPGDLQRYEAATAHLEPPFAVVDLTAMRANAEAMTRRAAGKPIRLASKSVRCRELMSRVLAMDGFRGILAFTLPEALWLAPRLAQRGARHDIVVAYPTADHSALARLAGDPAAAAAITVMVDCPEHLDMIEKAAATTTVAGPGGPPGCGCCGWPPGPAPSTAAGRSGLSTRRSAPRRSTPPPRPRWDRKNEEAASSSSPCSSRLACPPGSPAPSMTPAGTANCGRKPTRRSR
jgi:hypothetical protein